MVKPRVLLLGATGNTGKSVLEGLLEYGRYEVEALVRPSSAKKHAVKRIAERGVKIIVADLDGPMDELIAIQRGVDVTISAIDAASQLSQTNLAIAAKEAGVKRFVPCAWITVAPVGGVMHLRDSKEEVYNHIKRLHLPYTIIDVGFWYQLSFPNVPSGRTDYASLLPINAIHGDGNIPTMIGDLRDVGRWTARIIEDERTLNKSVFAISESLTENQIYAIVEGISGEKCDKHHVPLAEVEKQTHELRAKYESEPSQHTDRMPLWQIEYRYSKYVRGDNQPQYAKYLGYLDARELYPDFKPTTFDKFVVDLLDGNVERPYGNRD